MIDLGCGDGRIVVAAARDFGPRYGVDIDPERIAESNANARKAKVSDRVRFEVADIMKADIHQATVVALFLLDSVNLQLRPRLFAQLQPGTRVVSNTFSMGDWKADKSIRHGDAFSGVIYYWVIPASVGGQWNWTGGTGDHKVQLTLNQEFQVVTGTLRLGQAAPVPLTSVSLSGSQFRLQAEPTVDGKPAKLVLQWTVKGDVISAPSSDGRAVEGTRP